MTDAADPGERTPPEPAATAPEAATTPEAAREPRPWIERIGLAFIALLLVILFGGVSAASWVGGEPFLAIMAGIGCLMTLWVGAMTLVRG